MDKEESSDVLLENEKEEVKDVVGYDALNEEFGSLDVIEKQVDDKKSSNIHKHTFKSNINNTTTVVNLKGVDIDEWLKDPQNVYIGPHSKLPNHPESEWAVPPSLNKGSRSVISEMYEEWLLLKMANDHCMFNRIKLLRGKRLGCWCHPLECHGDVIVDILDWAI